MGTGPAVGRERLAHAALADCRQTGGNR